MNIIESIEFFVSISFRKQRWARRELQLMNSPWRANHDQECWSAFDQIIRAWCTSSRRTSTVRWLTLPLLHTGESRYFREKIPSIRELRPEQTWCNSIEDAAATTLERCRWVGRKCLTAASEVFSTGLHRYAMSMDADTFYAAVISLFNGR